MLVTARDEKSDVMARNVADLLCNSLVLLYGRDNVQDIKSVERFKREIKVCKS